MVKTIYKNRKIISETLLLLLFAIFPFGQILKTGNLLFLDIVVGLIALFTLSTVKKYSSWYRSFTYFILFALFSWIINYFIFENNLVLKGLLYLVRVYFYSLVPVFVSNHFKDKSAVVRSLLAVSVVAAIFGWLQYFIIPDTREIKILGWDDHYYRLIGTFLDPGFTAIIFSLGAIIALHMNKYLSFSFLVLSLLFTYSRAGYLALFVSLFYYLYKIKKLFLFFVATVLCILYSVFFLPIGQNEGEGVKLSRTSTISARLLNYKQSFEIISKSPLIGVGYNNICPAKIKYLGETNSQSHSCFGLDNSILFILATTGVVGLVLFISYGLRVMSVFSSDYFLISSFLAVAVHSLFSNTFFYPHVMVWIGVILGLQSEVKSK